MRRENRKEKTKTYNFKNIIYLSGSILGLTIIIFVITFVVYGNRLNKQAKESMLNNIRISDLVPSLIDNSTAASSEIGKTVEEQMNNIIENTVQESTINNTIKQQNTTVTKTEPEPIKDPEFIRPVEGEIMRNYAKDNLVYSLTLDEWVTHLGIDIKADKTTVVKAASAGKVKSIKNDPRFGLSIVIEHQNNFITVYSNLLSSEFITVGEEVKQGQSIGTVGNTAIFEIADDYHLHFEILKDNIQLDPMTYIK